MVTKYLILSIWLVPISALTFHVLELSNCDDKFHPISINFQLQDTNYIKYGEMNFTIPLDNPLTLDVSYSSDNKKFRKLLTIREQNTCEALNKYFGEIWFSMQRASHMEPRICPVKKGNYTLTNLQVNMDKLALPMLPKILSKNRGKIIGCAILEAINK